MYFSPKSSLVSTQSFRTQFRELCADAKLPPLPRRPYSLRRGANGAFSPVWLFGQTAVRGRWQSTRTARLYVDEGCRGARIHCVHAGPRASHPIFGGECGHCTDALSVNQNWQQVETAADWTSCSLPGLRRPFRGVRRVMVVPCLRRPASRCRGTWRQPAFRRNSAAWHTNAKGYSAQAVKPDVCRCAEIEKKHISSTTVSTNCFSIAAKSSTESENTCTSAWCMCVTWRSPIALTTFPTRSQPDTFCICLAGGLPQRTW